jgi:hypothetical protein
MAMQKVSVLLPPLPPEPRGAVLAAAVAGALLDAAVRLRAGWATWREASRARRAGARTARRDARERARLIALAHHYESSQPEFAKDLFAAAKRDSGA